MGVSRWAALVLLGTVLVSARASAQGQPQREPPVRGADPHAPAGAPPRPGAKSFQPPVPARPATGAPAPGRADHDHAVHAGPGHAVPGQGAPHDAPGRARPVKAAPGHAEHGQGEHGQGEHAEHDEKAPPASINWWHGLLGVKEGTPPNLLWRAPGEPPPFLASLLNFAVLVFLVVRFGRKPLAAALTQRKEAITREINEAQRLRKAAEERLKTYESKLEKISDELERVRREFREHGEHDKQRIVAEAKERRERMQKETEIVLAQEAKQMRHELLAEVVKEATRLATEILAKGTTLGDHDRFAEAFLGHLRGAQLRPGIGPRGGSSMAGPAAAGGSSS